MTIAVDEVITAAGGQGAVSTITLTKVGNTSPTGLLLQFVSRNAGGAGGTLAPTSVTYAGAAISLSTFDLTTGDPTHQYTCYYGYLASPTSGIQNLVFTFPDTTFKNVWLLTTFWTGAIDSVSWTTRAPASVSPVVNIAKAATSAVASLVLNGVNPTALTFVGPGTSRTINPEFIYGATQEPAQGTGAIDWQYIDPEEGLLLVPTSHVSAEIIAAAASIPMGGTFQLMFGTN